jgi:gliding motility-associated-like protein
MRIYRDCATGGADFDSGIGAQAGTISIYGRTGEDPINITLGSPRVRRLSFATSPCVQLPDNICVEEGLYTFNLVLPIIDESYYIVYQRCCRNATVSNIRQPTQAGATYYTEITPTAQLVCNNSARFNGFPPAALCLDEPFSFFQNGRDADGDSLSYEFYTPLLGGGQNMDDAQAPDGPAPNPDLPPPYTSVQFIESLYSESQPLGFASNLQLDPATGRISGRPRLWGRFVVGIVINEYRDGELIGQLRRDIQITAVPCFSTVVTHVENADSSIRQTDFFLWSCNGDTSVFFDNQSFSRISIDETRWEFYVNGDTLQQSSWDAEFNFPGAGRYEGALLVNPGGDCGDTARLVVNIEEDIEPNFTTIDSCLAASFQFQDLTPPNPLPMQEWTWYFGDGDSSRLQNPTYRYAEIGDYDVTLRVGTGRCDTTITKPISYYPAPTVTSILPDPAIFCGPSTANFSYASSPSGAAYETRWLFSPDDIVDMKEATYDYDDIGTFDVRLQITSPNGCQTDSLFRDLVTILPPFTADFTIDQDNCVADSIRFQDVSRAGDFLPTSWLWDFGNGDSSTERNPAYRYPRIGDYEVTLLVGSGPCDATITETVSYYPAPTITTILPDSAIFCGSSTANFSYTSSPSGDAYQTRWTFSPEDIFDTAEATYNYDSIGTFDVRLQVISPTGCEIDSLLSDFVTVLPPLIADFSVDYDSCAVDSIRFLDLSRAGDDPPSSWLWDFGDGTLSSSFDPIHFYQRAGQKTITLTAQLGQCEGVAEHIISYFPVPDSLTISPLAATYCGVQDLLFELTNSFDLTDDYSIDWDFGEGTSTNGERVQHSYTQTGSFDVGLALYAPNGCQTTALYENWVDIKGVPVANFDYTPKTPNVLDPKVQFINTSTDATAFDWQFNQSDFSSVFEPIYTFADTGFQEVTLIVTHESGCQDSLTRLIDIPPVIQAYLANAFSPNGDGINDEFKLQGVLLGIRDFRMSVWDRWGNLVFESTDPNQAWTGQTANLRQEDTHSATYAYQVSYQDARGKRSEHTGSILVVR